MKGNWSLADFGISRYAEATTDPSTRKFAMTPSYAAPEQWRHERATSAANVYAFGIVAFEMLRGRLPFLGPDLEECRLQHLHDHPPPLSGVHPALAALVSECLYEAPAARPTPANIRNRLKGIGPAPPSLGIQRLQEASFAEAMRRADQDRRSAAARSEAERRAVLAGAAADGLGLIASTLRDTIVSAAPAAHLQNAGGGWSLSLGGPILTFASFTSVPAPAWGRWGSDLGNFEVVAHTSLNQRIAQSQMGDQGRSHSLWFCNYSNRAEYAWFEGAFINAAILARPQPSQVPYALPPSEESAKALSRALTEFQVAWQFSRLAIGDTEEFIDRWAGWFGDAATGRLQHPHKLPEC